MTDEPFAKDERKAETMKSERLQGVALVLLRVVAGLLFLQAGGMKLFDWFGGVPGGHPSLLSQVWIGGVLEFYGGAAILLGLWTRVIAFILSGEMAVAYFQFHQPAGFWPIQNHGEPAVLFCFIFLFLAAHGAGNWSVDAALRSVREQRRRNLDKDGR
jgi:putative oxidoreductase